MLQLRQSVNSLQLRRPVKWLTVRAKILACLFIPSGSARREAGDAESYKRALTFLQNCERFTLRSLVRKSAKHHAELTVDHAKRVFSRALQKLDTSQGHDPTLQVMTVYLLSEETLQAIVNHVGKREGAGSE